jgi:hypothetical protein
MFWAAYFSGIASFLELPISVSSLLVSLCIVPGLLFAEYRSRLHKATASGAGSFPAGNYLATASDSCLLDSMGVGQGFCQKAAMLSTDWTALPETNHALPSAAMTTQRVIAMTVVCICVSVASQLALNAHKVLASGPQSAHATMHERDAKRTEKKAAALLCFENTHFALLCCAFKFADVSIMVFFLFEPLDLGHIVRRAEVAFFSNALRFKALQHFMPLAALPVMGFNLYL